MMNYFLIFQFKIMLEFIITQILTQIIFEVVCYFTGRVVIYLVTFGKYYPDDLIQNKKLRQSQRNKGIIFNDITGKKRYISPLNVSLIGLIF